MSTTSITSLDHLLGQGEGRYFATGHRNVTYDFHSDRSTGDRSLETVRLVAAARYPGEWSLNTDGSPRTPHLSSVDAIVLTVMGAQELATSALETHSQTWIQGIELRAGPEPWLDLLNIPVDIPARSFDTPDNPSEVIAQVGNIRTLLRPSAVHVPSFQPLVRNNDSFDDSWSVYANSKRRSSSYSSVNALDRTRAVLKASHEFIAEADSAPLQSQPEGFESSFWPALTVIDYLVTMGQLTQALVYAVSGRDRSQISNLWMRTMRITNISHPLALPARLDTTTRLTKDHVIDRGNGRVHNLAVRSQASNGVTAEATLAYTEIGELA